MLTAERSHGAVLRSVLHCHPPGIDTQAYSLGLRQSHYDYETELI